MTEPTTTEIDVNAITQPLLEQCTGCGIVFKFSVTGDQEAHYYAEPRTMHIQDIFPEIEPPVRAVLSRGNICAMCTTPSDETKNALKPYLFNSDRSFFLNHGQPVMLVKERYFINGRDALATYGEKTLTPITVNIPEIALEADEVIIREEGEHAGLRSELITAHIIAPHGRLAGDAYPNVFICKLTF